MCVCVLNDSTVPHRCTSVFLRWLRPHLRRKLLAELVEDDQVAMEIARLEEEFDLLTEENRSLASVHAERAQQLEGLWLTDQTGPEDS